MNYFLALLPILVVIGCMLIFRWGSHKAGPLGWLAGLAIAAGAFGLNWQVLWVSQVKALLLALNVLLILWTALFLYNLVEGVGGIDAVAESLGCVIEDSGWLQIVLAWALTGVVEGLAGFGLPMAIVAPMLVSLGVTPVAAVAASAIGHVWAASFGNMGVVLQMLVSVTGVEMEVIIPFALVLLGTVCLGSGLAAAAVLGKFSYWRRILLLGLIMTGVQAVAASAGLYVLGSFLASLAGIGAGIRLAGRKTGKPNPRAAAALRGALAAYGLLTLLIIVTNLSMQVRSVLGQVVWQFNFPEVTSRLGLVTAAGPGQVFRPLIHPAFLILITSFAAYIFFIRTGLAPSALWNSAQKRTVRSGSIVAIGVIFMVGLSTLMEHTGMTHLIAQGMAQISGAAFPFISPLIGMLGSFATGSNSNSNVLFGPMQKSVALVLGIDAPVLLAGQTAGGSIGSMIAPTKLVVGCSTTGLMGQDGLVLRKTIPVGIALGILAGVVMLALVYL